MSGKLKGKSISKAFDDALDFLGGIKGVARAVGISESQVRRLRVGENKLRLEHALKIEKSTGGKIKASELGPTVRDFSREVSKKVHDDSDDYWGRKAIESESDELLSVEDTTRLLEKD